MNKYQSWQRLFVIVLILAIIGGIAIGILGRGESAVPLETSIERIIKIAVFFAVMIPLVLYWILPNTQWGEKRHQLSESSYIFSFHFGMVLGILGLISTLLRPEMVIRSHLFELLIALFGLNYVFWAMLLKARKSVDFRKILDEKQIANLTEAAADTFILSSCVMILMYFASYHQVFIIEGKIWFLIYIFMSMIFFSGFNIYLFRRT